MNRSVLIATIAFIAFLSFAGVLYASYVIISNTVNVTVQEYTLTLNVNQTICVLTDTIEFYGTLTKDASPESGVIVALYFSNNTSTGLSDVTAVDGSYSILWTATDNGTFSFYTKAVIP